MSRDSKKHVTNTSTIIPHLPVVHKFAAGDYSVTLMVSDTYGTKGNLTKTATVTLPQHRPIPNQNPGGSQPQSGQGSNNSGNTANPTSGNMIPLVITATAGAAMVLGSVAGITRFRRKP